jgi:hypothetical protein
MGCLANTGRVANNFRRMLFVVRTCSYKAGGNYIYDTGGSGEDGGPCLGEQ